MDSPVSESRYALAEELGDVLSRLSAFLRRSVLPSDLSASQALTLRTLERGGPQRVTDLAHVEGVRQPTCTALVNSLEERGWVLRTREDTDRRAVAVAITPSGREVVQEIRRARSRVINGYLAALTPAEQRALEAALPALSKLSDIGVSDDARTRAARPLERSGSVPTTP